MTVRAMRFFMAAALAVSLSPSALFAGGAGYDVSYLWHTSLDAVQVYKTKVGRTLGPAVAKELRVVKGATHYGLIYLRRGSGSGARKAAEVHTKVLRARGLESAAPIRSRDWTFVSGDGTVTTPTAVQAAAAKLERAREIEDLEATVESYIKELRNTGRLASDERTAWSVYDFTSGEKLVDINEDERFQAASLIKPFFALAFFHKVKEGALSYGPKSHRRIRLMLQRSHNPSTNWVMRQLGGPRAIRKILRENYGSLIRDTDIVEFIPPGGRTYRNKASVHDYSRFLAALWNDELPYSKELKRLMALGPSRIYHGAREVPNGTEVYNKTGSTARLCGDMGILNVEGPDGKRFAYTIIGVIEKARPARNYTSWIKSRGNVIRHVSNLVYKAISQKHHLEDGGV
jgi:beta-lactamase class A